MDKKPVGRKLYSSDLKTDENTFKTYIKFAKLGREAIGIYRGLCLMAKNDPDRKKREEAKLTKLRIGRKIEKMLWKTLIYLLVFLDLGDRAGVEHYVKVVMPVLLKWHQTKNRYA